MPLRLTPFEYILARLNLLPVPLFDAPLAPGIAKIVITGCELGLFDALDKGALPLDVLAERVECHPQGLQLMLQLLVSAGYLRYRRGCYSNTRMARRWLTATSPTNIAPYIVHSQDIVAIWDHVAEVVRTNAQAMCMPYEEDASTPEMQHLLARHYAGLASLATVLGGEVVYRVKLPAGSTRLLDVGGSHAGYSALFCRKYPELHSTILDLQAGIEAGQRTAKQMRLTERMSFVCGDIVKDDFAELCSQESSRQGAHGDDRAGASPAPTVHAEFDAAHGDDRAGASPAPTVHAEFDAALYFHIAHLLPSDLNAMILAKVAKTLRPGGMLVFVDQVTDQTHGSRLASLMVQFMALTMTTVGGTCYPFAVIRGWLEQAGMGQVRRYRLVTPGATLITAIKK